MSEKDLKKEFEIRNLKTLTNELSMKLKKAELQLNARVIKEVKNVDEQYKKEKR